MIPIDEILMNNPNENISTQISDNLVKENGPEIKVPQDMGPHSMRRPNKTQNHNLTKRNVHTTVKIFNIM